MRKITSNGFRVSSVVLGFLATLMVVLPALIVKDSDISYTGLQIAFGHEFASFGPWASGEIKFNFIVLIAYLLPLVGSLLIMFTKKGYLSSTVLFLVAAILLFLTPQFTVVTVTVLGNQNTIDVDWTYGIGLILAASFSILGVMVGMARISKQE
ncbi:MAG: hypothetical protein Q7I99_07965 [Acholeplasmataceae bacterium]|nr:hypothetical protein [Acholeplasmataceae bacterium]